MADEQTKFRSGFDTPMQLVGSDPEKDQWVGKDELGNDIYKHGVSGKKYTVAPVTEGKGLVEKAGDVYEAIPPMEEWEAPSFDEVMTTAKEMLGGVVEGAVNAVQAPSDPNASLGDVWGTASGMAVGGKMTSGAVPEGAEGMFVGVRDVSKIKRAREMAVAGSSPNDIAGSLGVRLNPNGVWVEEISDKDFRVKPAARSAVRTRGVTMAGANKNIAEHPELYERYPEVGENKLVLVADQDRQSLLKNNQGMYFPSKGELRVDNVVGDSTVLHEIQHAVQNKENWDGGANPETVMNDVNATFDNLPSEGRGYLQGMYAYTKLSDNISKFEDMKTTGDLKGNTIDEIEERLDELKDEMYGLEQNLDFFNDTYPDLAQPLNKLFSITNRGKLDNNTAHSMYERNYGEWEARKTQERRNMTDKERVENDPFKDAPKNLWTQEEFKKVLREVDGAITKSRGQTTYADEMMRTPRGYAEGGMVMNPEEAGAAPEVPVGALPEEVADDVDIKVSEGEYVIPANVVRYLGLEKIEALVNKAKEGLAEKEAEGRIGGDTAPEAPPDQSAQGLEAQMAEAIPKMAEGGLVEDNFTGVRQYTSADGRTFPIKFTNGKPETPVPAGATPVEGSGSSPTPATASLAQGEGRSGSMAPGHGGVEGTLADGVSRWSPDQFGQYEKGLGGVGEKVGGVLAGTLLGPLGKMAVDARKSYLSKTVPDVMKSMIETGVDAQGNKLTTDQIESLKGIQSKIAAKETLAAEQKKGPLGQIGAALGVAKGLMTPMGAITAGVNAIQNKVTKAAPTSTGTAANPYGNLTGGGGDGLGSTLGKSEEEQSKANASTGNGGLYAKGGLVTRVPTPMPKYGKGGLVTRKKKK